MGNYFYINTEYPKKYTNFIIAKSSKLDEVIHETSFGPRTSGRYIELSKYLQMNNSEKTKKIFNRIKTETAKEILTGFGNINLGKYGYRATIDNAMEYIIESGMGRVEATSYIEKKVRKWENELVPGSRVFDTPLINESQIFMNGQISICLHPRNKRNKK